MQLGWNMHTDQFKIESEGDLKVITAGKKTYYAYAVVIATGSYHRKLEVPGKKYAGRGVSYCAVW